MAREDVIGKEENGFSQDEELGWDEEDLGLVWDEAEFQRIASQLRNARGIAPR